MKDLEPLDVGALAVDGPTSADRRGASAAPADEDLVPSVLTVDEVAALLRLERKTVYAALQRGEIPGARRIGRVIRLSRSAVLRWLAEGQGPPRTRRRR